MASMPTIPYDRNMLMQLTAFRKDLNSSLSRLRGPINTWARPFNTWTQRHSQAFDKPQLLQLFFYANIVAKMRINECLLNIIHLQDYAGYYQDQHGKIILVFLSNLIIIILRIQHRQYLHIWDDCNNLQFYAPSQNMFQKWQKSWLK